MSGFDVKICTFINGQSGPITINGKTIIANSAKENALSIVEAYLAKFDGMLANRQTALFA